MMTYYCESASSNHEHPFYYFIQPCVISLRSQGNEIFFLVDEGACPLDEWSSIILHEMKHTVIVLCRGTVQCFQLLSFE